MGFIAVLLVFIIFGIPSGIIMLIAEILINYSRDKETKAKLENLIPKRDTSHDTSFPDLQNTIGGKRQDVPGKEKKEYTYTYTSNGTPVSESTKNETQTVPKTWKVNNKEPYARPTKKSRKNQGAAIACFAISGLTFYTAASEVFEGIAEHGFSHITEFAGSVPMLLLSIACLIAGLWLVISKQRKIDKENRYIAIINQGYGMIPIDNISYLFPKPYDDCVKDLQEMINKGTLPDAYIDYGRRLLVIDPNNNSIEPVIAPEAVGGGKAGNTTVPAASKKAKARKSEADHVDFMSLERLSKKVSDEDIKLKLIRISSTLKTIGQKAEEDPSIRTDAGVDTFMDMYLPKTIRLVEEYEQVDKAAALPENNELKANILETLDAIDNAAMTLWKDIIHSDMIDISAELDALQTKLVMDGYSESDFRKNEEAEKIQHASETQAYDMSDMDPEQEKGEKLDEDVFSKIRKEQEKTKEPVH